MWDQVQPEFNSRLKNDVNMWGSLRCHVDISVLLFCHINQWVVFYHASRLVLLEPCINTPCKHVRLTCLPRQHVEATLQWCHHVACRLTWAMGTMSSWVGTFSPSHMWVHSSVTQACGSHLCHVCQVSIRCHINTQAPACQLKEEG